MNRIIALSLFVTGAFGAFCAHAQSQHGTVIASSQPGYYQPARRAPASQRQEYGRKDWYAGAAFVQNFAFFTENQEIKDAGESDKISHSGAAQPGGSVFIGRSFDDNWRAELELGYLSEYSQKDCDGGNCFTTRLSTPYVSINATYNTTEQNWGWVYTGIGVGIAMPNVSLESSLQYFEKASQPNVSVMPSAMVGYRARIADAWFADLGYKFSMYDAGKLEYIIDVSGTKYDSTSEFGWVMNHALKIGLAYEF
ncbi:MAG: porin family protein [Alphaproteobacteria bacterium]|nr:porin family protein [Alphaproteobacteria bacterium]